MVCICHHLALDLHGGDGRFLGELVNVLAVRMGEELGILVTFLVDLRWLIAAKVHHL